MESKLSFNYFQKIFINLVIFSLSVISTIYSQDPCEDAFLTSGLIVTSNGVSNDFNGSGAPNGSFTGIISGNNDELSFSLGGLPGNEVNGTLCVTVGFNNRNGQLTVSSNDESTLIEGSATHSITNVTGDRGRNPQQLCMNVTVSAGSILSITETGNGNMILDGLTFEYCDPCDLNNGELDCDGDGLSNSEDDEPTIPCIGLDCDCDGDVIESTGSYISSSGINNASNSDGLPDNVFTSNISNRDILKLGFDLGQDSVYGEFCVVAGFNNAAGEISFIFSDQTIDIVNPIGDNGRNPQTICIPIMG